MIVVLFSMVVDDGIYVMLFTDWRPEFRFRYFPKKINFSIPVQNNVFDTETCFNDYSFLFQVFRASTVLGIPLHLLSRDRLEHFIEFISRYTFLPFS